MSSYGCTESTKHLADVLLNRASFPLSMLHQTLKRPLATRDTSLYRHPHTLPHSSVS